MWQYFFMLITFAISVAAIILVYTKDTLSDVRDSQIVQNELNRVISTNSSVAKNTLKSSVYGYCGGAEPGSVDVYTMVTKYTDGTRVLLYGQQNPIENGTYIVYDGKYGRTSDLSSDSQVKPGGLVYAGGNLFVLESPGPFSNKSIVTAPLTFTQIV